MKWRVGLVGAAAVGLLWVVPLTGSAKSIKEGFAGAFAPATTPDAIYATAESFAAVHPNDPTPTLTKFAPTASGDIAFRVDKILCDANSCSTSPQAWLSGVMDTQIRQASASSPYVHGANITRTNDTTFVSSSDPDALYLTSTVPNVPGTISNVTGSTGVVSVYGSAMPTDIRQVSPPSPETAYAANMVLASLGASVGKLGASTKDLEAAISTPGDMQARIRIIDQASLATLYDATITSTMKNGALDAATVSVNSRSGVDVQLRPPQSMTYAKSGTPISLDSSSSFNWQSVLQDTGSWLSPYGECVSTSSTFCKLGGEFMVKIQDTANGKTGLARMSNCVSDNSGGFWYFEPSNVELITKALDATTHYGHNWIFASATSSTPYVYTAKNTITGQSVTFTNPSGHLSQAFIDTKTFAATSDAQAGTCVPSDTTMCKLNNIFAITSTTHDFNGNAYVGHVVDSCHTDSSESVYFFSPNNTEMQFKVLDGCKSYDHVWVFQSALTNVEYDAFYTHVPSGKVYKVHNDQGVSAPTVADTGAFSTCSYSNAPGASSLSGASVQALPIPPSLLNQTGILNGTTGGGH